MSKSINIFRFSKSLIIIQIGQDNLWIFPTRSIDFNFTRAQDISMYWAIFDQVGVSVVTNMIIICIIICQIRLNTRLLEQSSYMNLFVLSLLTHSPTQWGLLIFFVIYIPECCPYFGLFIWLSECLFHYLQILSLLKTDCP